MRQVILGALWLTLPLVLRADDAPLVAPDPPAATAAPLAAPPPAPTVVPGDDGLRALADHALACTVGISCRKGEAQSFTGTGAVISPDGHILTSTTVVPAGAHGIQVMFGGFVVREATIVETNDSLEVAIIKVDARGLPCLPLARELPRVGERSYTTSNANEVLRRSGVASFSVGIISGLYRVENLGGESQYSGLAVETTAAVNPGTDGGPMLNEAGQICGVVSLNVSPSRWQGVGVPTSRLLEEMKSLKEGGVPVRFEPLPFRARSANSGVALARHAAALAPYLAGVEVERKFPPEVLPRTTWEAYRAVLGDWEKKTAAEQARLIQEHFDLARILEVNQMLRRPAAAVTGLVVSSEGHVLTSSFNLDEDTVFLDKKTGRPRTFESGWRLGEFIKEPEGGYERGTNPARKVTVVLSDGSRHDARIVARHVPLGIALLKIDRMGLACYDVASRAAAPRLGAAVGVIGRVEGASPFTLNTGIVSSERRNRGFQWQTDALLNYGNSGGPVLDEEGKFLGLATTPIEPRPVLGRVFSGAELNGWSMAPNSGVGMIARGDRIAEVLESLKNGASTLVVPGAFLGVGPDPRFVFGAEAVVGTVAPNSPASKAGLKSGDRLLAINGQELNSWRALNEHLAEFKPGDKIELTVRRPGIVKKLLINGKSVSNESELQALLNSLKPNEKFEGTMVAEDVKVLSVVLEERK